MAAAQQLGTMRRVDVSMGNAESDAEGQALVAAFRDGLRELGWIGGHNIRFDVRWAAGNATRAIGNAVEFASLGRDVIHGSSTPKIRGLKQATQAIPS